MRPTHFFLLSSSPLHKYIDFRPFTLIEKRYFFSTIASRPPRWNAVFHRKLFLNALYSFSSSLCFFLPVSLALFRHFTSVSVTLSCYTIFLFRFLNRDILRNFQMGARGRTRQFFYIRIIRGLGLFFSFFFFYIKSVFYFS